MQEFDGSFPADSLFPVDDLGLEATPAPPVALVNNSDVLKALWNTTLALAVLKKRFGSEQAAWEVLEEKAHEWVLEKIADELGIVREEEAEKLFAQWMNDAMQVV